jgi:hypothetical protein
VDAGRPFPLYTLSLLGALSKDWNFGVRVAAEVPDVVRAQYVTFEDGVRTDTYSWPGGGVAKHVRTEKVASVIGEADEVFAEVQETVMLVRQGQSASCSFCMLLS